MVHDPVEQGHDKYNSFLNLSSFNSEQTQVNSPKTRNSRNSFSGELQVPSFSFLALYIKTITPIFLWHVESCLEAKIPSSKLSLFAGFLPYTQKR